MELGVLAANEAPEQEAPGESGDQEVAVHGAAELLRGEALAPDLVAAAIVADAGGDGDGDQRLFCANGSCKMAFSKLRKADDPLP